MSTKITLLVVLAAIGILIIATSPHYGITWDEPAYFKATALHMEWIDQVVRGALTGKARAWLQDPVISQFWHWDPYHVPHPPLSRILSGLTWMGTRNFLGEVGGFRLSTALFFLVLLWVVWAWTRALTNATSAWAAMLSTLAMPHLFGHAHFAMTDVPIATLWILTAYAFWRGLEKTSWSVSFGLLWGLAMATKFPGYLIPIPLILWSFFYKINRVRIYKNFFAAVFLSPLVLVLVDPYLWHFTLARIPEFINASITRPSFGTLFYNKIYSTSQLPWYYSFFILGVSIPLSILLSVVSGIIASIPKFRSSPEYILPVFCVSFLLILPLLPGAVIHDGVRLLLPVFPFLAVLSGIGFNSLVSIPTTFITLKTKKINRERLFSLITMGIIIIPALYSLLTIHPFELSYYNALIGGVRGADRKGLEVTYLQEVVSSHFLNQINHLLPNGATLNGTMSQFLLVEYQARGMLRKDLRLVTGADCDYYLVLMRKSSLRYYFDQRPEEKALIDRWGREGKEPILARTVQGVPLLLLYKVK
jgi:hypothetical protein